jgi:hypothetical protein
MGRTWKYCLIVFFAAAFFLAPSALTGIDLYDEGIRLNGAERILAGETPYLDFYAVYGPATFYWIAGLFKLFGEHLLAARVGLIFWNALAATGVFAFCRKMDVGIAGALIAFTSFLLPRTLGSWEMQACDPSVGLILWAGVFLIDRTTVRSTLLAGLFLGLAALFRYDFGMYGTIAGLMACLLSEPISWNNLANSLKATAWLLFGILLTAGVGYGTLLLLNWQALVLNLVTYTSSQLTYRRVPFSFGPLRKEFLSVDWRDRLWGIRALCRWAVYCAPMILAMTGLPLLSSKVRRRIVTPAKKRSGLAFLLFLTPGLTLYGFGRSDWPHLFPLYVVSILLFVMVGDTFCKQWLQKPLAAAGCALTLVIGIARASAYLHGAPVPLDKCAGIVEAEITPDKDFYVGSDWVVRAVTDLQKESGPMFVAAERHDRIFASPIVLHFFAGRPSATYFYQFDPGITTTKEVQQRIIADLEKNQVQTVFVWRTTLPTEPNLSSISSGVYLLDSYLASTYGEVKVDDNYRILTRRAATTTIEPR